MGDFVAPNADTLIGADPSNPGSSAEGVDTITNESAGVLSNDSLARIADGIDDFCDDHQVGVNGTLPFIAACTLGGASFSGGTLSGSSVTLPTGTYRLGADLELKANVTGSGTLIVSETLFVDTGGSLTWTGTVIVQSDDAALIMKKNVTVDGVLALQAIGSTATVNQLNGSELRVNGAYVILADTGADLVLDGGSKTFVTGIFALMGQDIGFDLGNGSDMTITGSMAIATPLGASQGISKIDLGSGSHATFGFDQSQFTKGVHVLGQFFDPDGKILPISAPKYWEVNARATLTAQEARIGGVSSSSDDLGMP